jgi:hypothetical protein
MADFAIGDTTVGSHPIDTGASPARHSAEPGRRRPVAPNISPSLSHPRSLQRALRLLRQSEPGRSRRLPELRSYATSAAGQAELGRSTVVPASDDTTDGPGRWGSSGGRLGAAVFASSVGAFLVPTSGRSGLQRYEFRKRPEIELREPAAIVWSAGFSAEFRRGAVYASAGRVRRGSCGLGASAADLWWLQCHVARR